MRILVTEPVHEEGLALLGREFDVDLKLGMTADCLLAEIGEYEALITRSGTSVPASLLRVGAGRLKVVGRAGIGVDNIDINAATENGVAVVNAPTGNVRAAAEHTIALLFALCKNIPQAHNLLRDGVWGKSYFMGCEVAGKTLGIIGHGKVGHQVARRALALDMEVVVYDPFAPRDPGVSYVSLDDLLRYSDFVTLHVPLTPLTAGMIGERELSLMKPGAYLINCARGKVVDECALYKACQAGSIGGAALDVFASEPVYGGLLLELDNVIVTPHLGGTTQEAMKASALEVAAQVRAVLLGEYPTHIVNPEVLGSPITIIECLLNRWQPFGRVVLDCDSTLSQIEGINELGAMNGLRHEVAEMTTQAMGGRVPFEEVFAKRLELIKPSKKQLASLGRLYVTSLVEDAAQVAGALLSLGIDVRLVSGGYRDALLPLAAALGVPGDNVHANDLHFDAQGDYSGFDGGNPLSRSGGKREVVAELAPAGETLFMGDGASDVEALGDVELFVGYGGVEKRGTVLEHAPVYLHSESLAPLLVMAAGMEGCCKLLKEGRYRGVVIKGLAMLTNEGTDYRPEYEPFFRRVRKFCLEGICS